MMFSKKKKKTNHIDDNERERERERERRKKNNRDSRCKQKWTKQLEMIRTINVASLGRKRNE